MISFVCDAAITVRDMVKFGMKLKSMEMLTTQLRSISDSMAQGIFEGVVTTQKSMDEFKDGVAEYTKEGIEKTKEGIEKTKELQKKYEELYTKYTELFNNKRFTNHRFTKAFPNMKSKIGKTKEKYNAFWDKYNELWDKYKNMFS